jgi:osmotically inducible protein OsmC
LVESVGSGAFTGLPITWNARTASHDGRTSPEELVAAAHASCFAMAFSNKLAGAGHPAVSLAVSATVDFEKLEGGWTIVKITLAVAGSVPGIDQAQFDALAADAKATCPISRALNPTIEVALTTSPLSND